MNRSPCLIMVIMRICMDSMRDMNSSFLRSAGQFSSGKALYGANDSCWGLKQPHSSIGMHYLSELWMPWIHDKLCHTCIIADLLMHAWLYILFQCYHGRRWWWTDIISETAPACPSIPLVQHCIMPVMWCMWHTAIRWSKCVSTTATWGDWQFSTYNWFGLHAVWGLESRWSWSVEIYWC